MGLAVTTFYAGLCALIFIWLALRVIGRRRGAQISLSDGGDEALQRLTRAHSNTAEWMPIFLILLAGVESLDAPGFVLHLAALPFVAGRFLHGWHFVTARTDFRFRALGMHLTIWPMLALALGGIAHGFISMI